MVKSRNISLIAALGPDGLIGRKGGLIFHLPADMKYFRNVTMGKPVVMGRKTYESIPKKFRPLDGRINIVLTRNKTWKADEGVIVVHDLSDIFQYAGDGQEIMIAGGEDIYAMTLPIANKLYITDIIRSRDIELPFTQRFYFEGVKNKVAYDKKRRTDAFFPIVPKEHPEIWKQISSVSVPDARFLANWVVYERI